MPNCKHFDICGLEAIDPEGLCILHSKDPQKDKEAFQKELHDRLNEKNYDFRLFYFPEGTCGFSNRIFEKKASFLKVNFQGKSYFSRVTFQDEISFLQATFQGEANFFKTIFLKEANFVQVAFKEKANFSVTIFQTGCKCIHRCFGKASTGSDKNCS